MIFVKFYTLSAINIITNLGTNFDKKNILISSQLLRDRIHCSWDLGNNFIEFAKFLTDIKASVSMT